MTNRASEAAVRLEAALRAWLTLQCPLIGGVESALAVLGPLERVPGISVAAWPSREQVSPRLSATVDFARECGELVVQEPREVVPGGTSTEMAAPLKQRGRSVGVLGVSVRGVPRERLKAVAERLMRSIQLLELVVEALGERERLASHLSLAGTLLDHEQLAEASHALCAELALRLGCERVGVGLRRRGRLRVVALSTSLRFSEESEALRDVRACMEEALEQDAALELPAPDGAAPHVLRAHEQLRRSGGAEIVRSFPLAALGRGVGALTCEWSRVRAPGPALRASLDDAALLGGPILDLLARAQAGLLEHTRAALGQRIALHFGAHRGLARAALAAAAAAVVLLCVVPGNYRVSARARLEGRVQRALVAPVEGFIEEANARAGDVVRSGEVLARLDDRDLRLERRKWEGQLARLAKEQRQALAALDRTQVSILGAQIEQANAELGLAEEQLERTSVVAPFDGIVLEGDLTRSLGSPVDRGSVLFQIAPLDGYRIILQVDERDVADIAVGQRGRLALSALPGQRFALLVERITPMSTAEGGRNYFRVESALEQPSEALRPGMEGVAKIDVGRRRLLWIWTHELLDWLRLWTWSYLPLPW